MKRQSQKLLIEFLRPAVVPVGLIVKGLYWASFGWWLDKYLGRRSQKCLARDVREAIPFLFTEYKGHIVANDGVRFPEPFDYATITIAFDSLFLRFVRGRGIVGKFAQALRGVLSGEFQVVEYRRGKRVIKAQLQQPSGTRWKTIATWSKLRFPSLVGANTSTLRNSVVGTD